MIALIFIDTETRSRISVKTAGAHAYAADPSTRVIVLTYAIDDGEVECIAALNLDMGLQRSDLPTDLLRVLRLAHTGRAKFIAWNAAFDRLVLARLDAQFGEPRLWWDCMVAATRMHYPPDLAGASAAVGGVVKRRSGKRLIRQFSDANVSLDLSAPDVAAAWEEFLRYAVDDVGALRSVWRACGHLDPGQWPQYHVSEAINDAGLPVDLAAAEAATGVAEVLHEEANQAIHELTSGEVPSATAVARLGQYLQRLLDGDDEALALLTAEGEGAGEDEEEEGEENETGTISLRRENVEALVAMLDARAETRALTDAEARARALAQARLDGSGAAARKYRSITSRAVWAERDGWRLRGEYTFNGAAATGRFSSRGVQVHNLPRQAAGTPDDLARAFDILHDPALSARERYVQLRELFPDLGRALGRLIRPCITAPPGRVLVWGDWSAIEARALPWLAGADEIVDMFRAADADPEAPDVYVIQASRILGKDPRQITKEERQIYGKVPVLSLGYGGGVGALHKMAHAYGVTIEPDLATQIVRRWRADNVWAGQFWRDLEGAFRSCIGTLYKPVTVGRLQLCGVETGDDRTVLITLPCGRWLAYPQAGVRMRRRVDAHGRTIDEASLAYTRGRGVGWIWGGLLAENVTQGVCASLLRAALVAAREPLAAIGARIVGHVHDEVIAEAPLQRVDEAKAALHDILTTAPGWAHDWPLRAEVATGMRYGKA